MLNVLSAQTLKRAMKGFVIGLISGSPAEKKYITNEIMIMIFAYNLRLYFLKCGDKTGHVSKENYSDFLCVIKLKQNGAYQYIRNSKEHARNIHTLSHTLACIQIHSAHICTLTRLYIHSFLVR